MSTSDGVTVIDGGTNTVVATVGIPPPIGKQPYIVRFDIYPTDVSLHKIDGSDLFVLASYFGDSCP